MRKKRKLFVVMGLLIFSLMSFITLVLANPILDLQTAMENEKIQLRWKNPYNDSKNYPYAYRLFRSIDNGATFKPVSMWTADDEVKVLNIFPQASHFVEYRYSDGTSRVMSKAASMKIWMEGGTMIDNGVSTHFDNYGRDLVSGRQLIKVDPVSFDDFNASPDHYLKDTSGNYKYDVIAFGTWDGNNYEDLNQAGADATARFIQSGRGAFFGHDTLYIPTSPITFKNLAPYVGISKLDDGVEIYNGVVGSETGRGNVGENEKSKVKITSKSSLTSYPWNIGNEGTSLIVPGAHNLQAANGQVLMRFDHPAYTNADLVPDNFFLTLHNNTAMSQTGHSNGDSTEDERKILANTLFYLKQVSSKEYATDADISDLVAPENLSAQITGCPTSDEYKKNIHLNASDRGTSYQYYLEGIPQIQGHGTNVKSRIVAQESSVGIDAYWYTINTSPNVVQKPSKDDAMWKKANNGTGYDFTTDILDNTKTQYIHYFAKDKAGNVSKEAVYTIPSNTAPVITVDSKTFYEGQYTIEKWQNLIRDAGLSASDKEDGVITEKIQLVSDTTNVQKAGTYQVTYKVKDKDCYTVIKQNEVVVKFNNPPVVKAIDKTFYEGQYSAKYWDNTLKMKDISATDVEDGDLTKKISVISDNVDVSKAGDYQVVYEVIDAYGKKGTATSKITVMFNNPPVIEAKNQEFYEDEITLQDWKEIREDIATASDIEDGNITEDIKIIRDNVNPTIPDTYEIVYEVSDQYGKSTTKTVEVLIKYNNPPIIMGENKRFMESTLTQEEWLEERIKKIEAKDVEEGDISSKIKVVKDDVLLDTPGFYHVTYEVSDKYGKKATKTIEVEIVYNQLPLIIAENRVYYENEITHEQWLTNEIMKDVKAIDSEDGDITNRITYEENVDVTTVGSYEVAYSVSDSLGKKATKTIDVMIRANNTPTLYIFAENKRFVEGQYTLEEWESKVRMENVSANDYEDMDLSDKIIIVKDSVDPSSAGIYEVTYKVTDAYGKSKEVTIKVSVEPNLAPVIYASDRYFNTTDTITNKDLLKKVIAYDDIDGELTDKVSIKSSEVIEGSVGEYKVVYTVMDSLGKEGTGLATVYISDLDPTPELPVDPPVPPMHEDALQLINGKKVGVVTLAKVMENSDVLNGTDYESVVFGVYTNEDIYWKDHLILRKDSLVGILRLDDSQQGSAKVYHEGTYYVREIAVNEQYILSDEKHLFSFAFE